MDEVNNAGAPDAGAWALSRLGYAIDAYVDRQVNAPQVLSGSGGAAYGIGANGELYQVGQPTTVQTVRPVAGGGTIPPVLLLAALAFFLSRA